MPQRTSYFIDAYAPDDVHVYLVKPQRLVLSQIDRLWNAKTEAYPRGAGRAKS